MNRRRTTTAPWALIVLVVGGSVGCGESPIAQVSGRAEFVDGSPLRGAVCKINFQPTDDSTAEVRKTASGEIGRDGSFTLFTRKPGDGVFKGKYAVTFTVLRDPNEGGLLVPRQYAALGDTPFQIEVVEDRDDLLFQLEKPTE